MPIGGGTFTTQNKILPGAYINFVSLGSVVKMGTRGIAALPLELNWGPENKVFSIYAEDFNKTALSVFGYDPTAADILLVREALKRARTLLIYRVNSGGTKATATVGGMSVTAAYANTDPGDIGNVDHVGSVGSIDEDVNIAEEDLKFLRDVAEMRYVQNFVTLTPTVAVDAKISEKVDVDEVVNRIESRLENEFEAAAEGVYA